MHPLLARSGIMGISTNSIVFYQLSSGNYIDNDVHNNVSIIFFYNWTIYLEKLNSKCFLISASFSLSSQQGGNYINSKIALCCQQGRRAYLFSPFLALLISLVCKLYHNHQHCSKKWRKKFNIRIENLNFENHSRYRKSFEVLINIGLL